jgi:hypothetical protein
MADSSDTQAPPIMVSAPAPTKTITLPSGKTALVRRGKGKDLMAAQRALSVGGASDGPGLIMALIAQLTLIDGQPIVYEDVLEMDAADVLELQGEIVGANFPSPPQPSSQA